jgi:hypothetical protein
MGKIARRLVVYAGLLLLAGCLSPIALDRATLAYNQATADILYKQLLLNIARSRHSDPIQFTGISNIAATFNFQVTAGITPALTGNASSSIEPLFSMAASENPTVSIVPMEGEEFTRRLLTPIQENKITLLLRQNIDIDLLLRLVAQEFRLQQQGGEVVYYNNPRDGASYEKFRQVVLHLSAIQDRNAMFAEPLVFERSWAIPVGQVNAQGFRELEQDYGIELSADKHEYHLSKQVNGRVIITNYDPDLLTNAERAKLNDEIDQDSPNDLEIDIRPGFPGGQYPLHGKFRLRSFSNILSFLGKAIVAYPERDVQQDPRTPTVSENPVYALQILESDGSPPSDSVSIEYKGQYYSVHPDNGYPWNKTAFRLLAQIFQMMMAEVPKTGVPSITIAK